MFHYNKTHSINFLSTPMAVMDGWPDADDFVVYPEQQLVNVLERYGWLVLPLEEYDPNNTLRSTFVSTRTDKSEASYRRIVYHSLENRFTRELERVRSGGGRAKDKINVSRVDQIIISDNNCVSYLPSMVGPSLRISISMLSLYSLDKETMPTIVPPLNLKKRLPGILSNDIIVVLLNAPVGSTIKMKTYKNVDIYRVVIPSLGKLQTAGPCMM